MAGSVIQKLEEGAGFMGEKDIKFQDVQGTERVLEVSHHCELLLYSPECLLLA